MNAIVSMSVWMWVSVWVWVSRYLWAELLLCVNANMSNATIYNHDCWLCCFPGWKWMTWQMERSQAARQQRQAQREDFDRNCERPRSRPRPPRRPRLESDSVTVRLQSSSRTRGDSYLNNHFSDSQLDFQIGFILWPPTAFLSYLYSPHSPFPPPHSYSHFPFIFPLARFNCLFDLWPRETFKRPTRLDSTWLVSSRIWAPTAVLLTCPRHCHAARHEHDHGHRDRHELWVRRVEISRWRRLIENDACKWHFSALISKYLYDYWCSQGITFSVSAQAACLLVWYLGYRMSDSKAGCAGKVL